jgi:hypothetical protein
MDLIYCHWLKNKPVRLYIKSLSHRVTGSDIRGFWFHRFGCGGIFQIPKRLRVQGGSPFSPTKHHRGLKTIEPINSSSGNPKYITLKLSVSHPQTLKVSPHLTLMSHHPIHTLATTHPRGHVAQPRARPPAPSPRTQAPSIVASMSRCPHLYTH